MTKPYRYNLDAAWDRNLDPGRKVASIAAGYGRDSGQPAHLALRLFFWNEGHAGRFLGDAGLRSIGGKLSPLMVKTAEGDSKLIVRFSIDLSMASRLPEGKVNARSLDRYKRLIVAIEKFGYKIDWQTPDRIVRLYKSRQEFEEATGLHVGISDETASDFPDSRQENAAHARRHYTDVDAGF